ncbi:MAG: type II toxin-antitoxin system VapC family toxin [Candidatus Micrarchaeota archaeon]
MFIDTNIFVGAYCSFDKKGGKCRNFLRCIESGEQNSSTSVLVLDETLKTLSNLSGEKRAISAVNKILEISNLEVFAVDKEDFENCLEYFKQSMDVHDSLHLAVMKKNGIKAILSYDKDFDLAKGIKRIEPK